MVSRFLDAKLKILGFEPDEFMFLIGPFLIFYLLDLTFLGVVIGIVASYTIKKIKSGKPEGYLIHLLYRAGVPFQGLLPPYITHYEE